MIFNPIENCLNAYYKPRLKLFKKLIGERVIDVLLHMPSHTIDKFYLDHISKDDVGKIVTTKVKIEGVEINFHSRKPAIVYSKNGNELVEILLFNYQKIYVKNSYPVGEEIAVSGKLTESKTGTFQFINPEKFQTPKIADHIGLFNIYPLTTGLSQNAIYSAVKVALKIIGMEKIDEWIPENIVHSNNFDSFVESLDNIHNPRQFYKNQLDSPYRKRLAFDELLAEQLAIRIANKKTKEGNIIKNEKLLTNKLLEILPFQLTDAQKGALDEIFHDLESGKPMTRLLQGDVGSGKTIVALTTAVNIIESGFQCTILAPTEILAQQHHKTIKKYLDHLGLSTALLTASTKNKERSDIFERIQNGEINILIGTHALLNDNLAFKNLGLVIIDEQHRFGVHQRLKLIEKSISPHILSMTATPIPRTIIMSLYGNISVSSITKKPIGRKEIITKSIPISRISEVITSIKNIISKGQKIYWICPLIEESEKLKYTCVTKRFEFLKQYFGDEVAMLHGKMKISEKQEIFARFKAGNCKILISTTVIEVGIDVPDASVIFIENAEKFGLAQLHQLRGRVGRSDIQSYCILLHTPEISQIASKRIEIIKNTNDGFKIAEQDLLLRGGGEILGTLQSGQKRYRTFDLYDPDNQKYLLNLLEQTSHLATEIMKQGSLKDYNLLLKIFGKENIEDNKLSF